MLSLRTFHFAFVLLAMLGADLFGLWSVWQYTQGGAIGQLVLGIAVLLGGLGLLPYAIHMLHMLDREHLH